MDASAFINRSENVSIWERSALPLRVDTSNAVTTVNVPTTTINATDLEDGEGELNKNTLGVFDVGSTISLSFEQRAGANTTPFAGENVKLLAARLTESGSPDTDGVSSNMTTTEMQDLLLEQNLSSEQVNENFSFTSVNSTTVGSAGNASFEFTPDRSGQYAFVLVKSDTGDAATVSNGNLSITDAVEIVGIDSAPVQSTTATATTGDINASEESFEFTETDTFAAGDPIGFNVSAGFNASNVSHTIVVFNESELGSQRTTLTLEGEINENLSADNVTVDSTIAGVDGSALIYGNPSVMGVQFANSPVSRYESGSVSFVSMIDYLANETNQTKPEVVDSGDTVLNASVLSVTVNGSNLVTDVPTSANWSNGTYEYLYIASTTNSSEFSTTKGSLTIGNDTEPETPELSEIQLDLTANRTNVNVPQAIRFTVTGDGNRIPNAQITLGNQSVSTNANGRATIRPSTVGNFTAKVTKQSTGDTTYLSDTVKITVNAAPGQGGGGPPAAGGGGGGQGGGGSAGTAQSVATNNGATVNFRDMRGGQPLSVDVPNVASDRSSVTGVELTTKFSEGRFRVEFTKPQNQPPSGTPALEATKGQAVDYFTAEAIGLSDDRIENVNFTFTLSESEIPGDRSKDDVRLFRHVDGEWVTLETTHLGGDQYRAKSPGFTAYAIGVQPAQAQETVTPTPTSEGTPTPTSEGTPTPTDGTPTPTGPEQPGGGPGPMTIGIVVILLLLAAAGAYYYTQQS